MASEQGGVSAAPVLSANLAESATLPISSTNTQPVPDSTRSKSLKRSRPDQAQNLTSLSSIANAGLGASPSPKSPRFKGTFSPGYSPITLTGAAAMEENRRKQEESQRNQPVAISENPGHKALSSLMAGGGAGMSKPQDAPAAATTMSEGMSVAANSILISSPKQMDEKSETSPASVTSLASLGSTAPTATAGSTVVASPASMTGANEVENREARTGNSNFLRAPEESPIRAPSLSYPGN
ncbi:hypothetical protein LSUE1_G010329, partial [Lachnellula suecica]